MVRIITVFIVLLMASVLQAGALPLKVIIKTCDQNSCSLQTGHATCVLIAKQEGKAVYLTAAHNMRGYTSVWVGFETQWHQARLVGQQFDENTDVAILETVDVPALKCIELTDLQPRNGAPAWMWGYPAGANGSVRKTGYVVEEGGLTLFTNPAVIGDSGGPVIVGNKLVGIVSGHTPRANGRTYTVYTDNRTIYTCLRRFYRRVPRCNCRPVIARPIPAEPLPSPMPNDSQELAALQGELSLLREQLDQLKNTQIPVWVVDADGNPTTWKDEKGVEHENTKTYPLGEPIKIYFPGR